MSSIFSKILDWIILIKEEYSLCSSELQFGFKKGLSTTQCTLIKCKMALLQEAQEKSLAVHVAMCNDPDRAQPTAETPTAGAQSATNPEVRTDL